MVGQSNNAGQILKSGLRSTLPVDMLSQILYDKTEDVGKICAVHSTLSQPPHCGTFPKPFKLNHHKIK
jgi:hypothetical protein